MSGKRNDVVDAGIVDAHLTGALGANQGKLDAFAASAGTLLAEDLLDATQDQALGGTSVVGGASFQSLVKGRGDVDGGAHISILPHLWLVAGLRSCLFLGWVWPAGVFGVSQVGTFVAAMIPGVGSAIRRLSSPRLAAVTWTRSRLTGHVVLDQFHLSG